MAKLMRAFANLLASIFMLVRHTPDLDMAAPDAV